MSLNWPGKSRNGNTPTVIGSVQILDQNPRRKGATIVNDGVNWIYVCKAPLAVVGTGIPLAPAGGAYEINLTNPYFGPLSVACGVAAANIAWTEDE